MSSRTDIVCPRRLDAEPEGSAPQICVHCEAPIREDELFLAGGPEAEHLRCAAAARGTPEPLCYTVGHGTRPLEEFIALLEEHEVRVLVDIRTVPRSRHNPQFEGEALARDLPHAGICYLHLKPLGGLRKPRRDSPNAGWRNESFRGYADYMLTPAFETALDELIALLRLQHTAIMCSETVYWRCHRSLVADALLTRGIPSLHLLQPGKATPHTLTRFARPEGTRLLYPPEEAELAPAASS